VDLLLNIQSENKFIYAVV